jgi:hypothetical protein
MNYSQPFFTIWDRMLGTYLPKPPKLKDQSSQAFAIHNLTLKAKEVIDFKDESTVFKTQKTISEETLPVRYNLRPRKKFSSI